MWLRNWLSIGICLLRSINFYFFFLFKHSFLRGWHVILSCRILSRGSTHDRHLANLWISLRLVSGLAIEIILILVWTCLRLYWISRLTPFIVLLLPILILRIVVIGMRFFISIVVSWWLLIGLILKCLLVAWTTATSQIDVYYVILLVLVLVIVRLIGLLLIIGWLDYRIWEIRVRFVNLVIVIFKKLSLVHFY